MIDNLHGVSTAHQHLVSLGGAGTGASLFTSGVEDRQSVGARLVEERETERRRTELHFLLSNSKTY